MKLSDVPEYRPDNDSEFINYILKVGSRLRYRGLSTEPYIISIVNYAYPLIEVCAISLAHGRRFKNYVSIQACEHISKDEAISILGDLRCWEIVS